MLRKQWFSEKNLREFNLDINRAYSLPTFLKVARNSARKENGTDRGLPYYLDLITALRQPTLEKLQDKDSSKYLFIFKESTESGFLFSVNKNFDWDNYENTFVEKVIAKPEDTDELTLLRGIAKMLNNEFRNKQGLFSSAIPQNIAGAMNVWNEKFNK